MGSTTSLGVPGMALRKPKADRTAEILDAAIALADAEGLRAVTLRAVGQRVGVTAMALYGYFPDKDSLLDAMADRVIGDNLPDIPGLLSGQPGWRDRLLVLAGLYRQVAREHPAMVQYGFTRPAETPGTLRVVELVYQVLLDAGVPPAEIPRFERFVSTFVMGWALSEVSGRFAHRMSRQERRELLGPDEMPARDKVAAAGDTHADPDAEFVANFTGILDLIDAARHS
jgi:AcrR family transcriptional regulator